MNDTATGTQGVLDAMTAGILQNKSRAAAGLTPVGAERMTPLAGPIPADFPWDMPMESVRGALREIRRQLVFLEQGCVAIEHALDMREGGEAPLTGAKELKRAEVTANEASADAAAAVYRAGTIAELDEAVEEDFTEAFARKSADAQAQAFTSGWRCPTHDQAVEKTSPKGRHFLACPKCADFER
jgi:hypothetical protein